MKEIFSIFSRLGVLGFGGPLATIAMMEEETSRKRKWLTAEQFSEAYALCKLLPGPVATQMAITLGRLRGGTWGGLLAGSLFILPSFFMVLAFSYFYTHSSLTQTFSPLFSGMQAGALSVILLSTFQLAKPYQRKGDAWAIALASACVVFFKPALEPLIILGFGLIGANFSGRFFGKKILSISPAILVPGLLFWTCFKAGAFVFGTGLAVVPVLEADVVQKFHWLTHSEFMDGLAIGQVTPGPVVITATFIGYKAAGLVGALVATFGIFFPAFVNILFFLPKVWKKMSGTKGAQGFTAWAIPAVIGSILATTLQLGLVTLHTPLLIGIFCALLLISLLWKPPAWAAIPLAGAVVYAWGLVR